MMIYKVYARIYQNIFRGVSYILPWREPIVFEGTDSILNLPVEIRKNNFKRALIVTDNVILKMGLLDSMIGKLRNENVEFFMFSDTVPNPTIDNIENALIAYKTNKCDCLIAFGGGSSMDLAKAVGARVAKPNKSISQLKGVLKIRKKTPCIFAVPTTAGTGSEATIAAVITDSKTHHKYAINDTSLIPRFAFLDPKLTIGLPPNLTSTTGLDALTHAVEAYIGNSNTKETERMAIEATKLIFSSLYKAYKNGSDIQARNNMLIASHLAGKAFTRAYVGYVHAIAHTFGGVYGIPHGLANAVILPHVLEYYGESVTKRLSKLAIMTGIGNPNWPDQRNRVAFIDKIKEMNELMNIPRKIGVLNYKDLDIMVNMADSEANPLYPVPRILNKKELKELFEIVG
jgi:alcohol dehydrogenase class IV